MNCEATQDYMCPLLTFQNFYLCGALVVLLYILIKLRQRQPKNIVAYKTENGDVTISRAAVVELVRTSCEQISQVSKPKLKVFTKKGLTHFNIRIQLISGGRLKDVEKMLQNHLRESLSNNLGIEKLGNVNIMVTSFKSSKIRSFSADNVSAIPSIQTQQEEELDVTMDQTEPKNENEE